MLHVIYLDTMLSSLEYRRENILKTLQNKE